VRFAAPLRVAEQRRILLPVAICTLIWGSTWLVIRTQLDAVPAAWSIVYRFVIATIGMLILCRTTGAKLRLPARGHALAAAIGIPQFGINYFCVYAAEGHITSGLVALLAALQLVSNTLLSRIFLGQRVSRRFLAGSGLAILGIALLFAELLHRSPAANQHNLLGILLSLAAIGAASAANVTQASASARAFPTTVLLTWGMVYGVLANAAVAFLTAGPPRLPLDGAYLLGLFYLAIPGTVIAFSLYFGLIRQIGPARASYVTVLIPIVAMTLSTIFEAYAWTPVALAGCGLTLVGLLVAIRARSPA
jgi:drug/metabolite transporter (DMT)-like permease